MTLCRSFSLAALAVLICSVAIAKAKSFPVQILGVKWGATTAQVEKGMRKKSAFTWRPDESDSAKVTFDDGQFEGVPLAFTHFYFSASKLYHVNFVFKRTHDERIISQRFVSLRKRLIESHGEPTQEFTRNAGDLKRSEWTFSSGEMVELAIDDEGWVNLQYINWPIHLAEE